MKLILAVSGGIDSVVLLDAFVQKRFAELGISLKIENPKLYIAHFDHGMQAVSGKFEKFVQQLAESYGLPFYSGRARASLRSEAAAREERYCFLRRLQRQLGADWIVTAHHADDQVETILLNLSRGAGLAGLAGMPEYRCSHLGKDSAGVWRPLVGVSKSVLEKYAKKHRLKFVTDPTNRDDQFARNRIRQRVLPELEQVNPRFREAILRTATQIRAAQEFLQLSARDWLRRNNKNSAIPLHRFNALSSALSQTVIRELHLSAVGHLQQIEEKHIEEVLRLVDSGSGGKQKKFGRLIFRTARQGGVRVLTWEILGGKKA